ncbi:uncharacterized protein N0V89_008900 [Didymosphaeria variabile]|uniref:DUF3533 domain-containing protein n=1 Tax=Didymosphaeria variabile TaxID=1932322 RepID=A0A9W8XII8_9PLEO|nr:uncharacterized protein N0V89_008900 [Didymosphaeria variabile]KAJ4350279.1 hypothetical protein N0V89_008900 [Didymosphaeria variabile]
MLSFSTCAIICAILTVLTLGYDENTYYPSVLGPILDLFFERDPHDDLVSGSGYTLFIDDNWKTISNFVNFLITTFWSIILLISLPPIIVLIHMFREATKRVNERDAAYRYAEENNGAMPPWRVKAQPIPPPTRDTRYMLLGGDGRVIWVCGVGGGFEDVINGDIEGAIARRWRRMGRKQFA